jgi:signal transduction histidine kinase
MVESDAVVPEHPHFILSTLSPNEAQRRTALGVIVAILVVFAMIVVGPLKGVHLKRVDAFVPTYVTAMFVCDSITALILYAQFAIVRSRASLIVASAYLFAALVMIPFLLVFPGVFVPDRGLMGGMQSTSWVYFFQHAGFPLFIVAYALIKDGRPGERFRQAPAASEIVVSVTLTVTLVLAGAFLCIEGAESLPRVTLDSMHFGALWWYPATVVALLNASAIGILWTRRRVALDLWLMIVMFLFAIEIPLSYYPDPQRFSVGWYAVRGFGVLASSVVLILLIHEITTLYARLLGAVQARRREREARLVTGDAVAASIAHEVRQPLTAMVTSAQAGLRFLGRAVPDIDKAREGFRQIVADGRRAGDVVASIRATLKTDPRNRTSLDVNELIQEALALERNDLLSNRIYVQLQPDGGLPAVNGDRIQVQQVLLNLITNAIHAMSAREEPRVLSVRSEAYEGTSVLVSVADTGMGVDSTNLERMFTPLFTTKSDGMGMGLSICRAIIEAHNGRLWFSPNTPRGAVFRFTLHGEAALSARA